MVDMTQNLVMSPSLGRPALTLVMAENYAGVGKSSCWVRVPWAASAKAKALPRHDRWDWNESLLVGFAIEEEWERDILRLREKPLSLSLAGFTATFTTWREEWYHGM